MFWSISVSYCTAHGAFFGDKVLLHGRDWPGWSSHPSAFQGLGLLIWVTTLSFFSFLSIKFLNFSPCISNCSIQLTTDVIFVSKKLERPKCLKEREVTISRDKNKHWIHPYPVYLTYIHFSLKNKTKSNKLVCCKKELFIPVVICLS